MIILGILKRTLLILLTAVIGGALIAATAIGRADFLVVWVTFSLILGAALGGYGLGRMWRTNWKSGTMTHALCLVVSVAVGVFLFILGMRIPPVMGQIENQIVFPGLLLIGLLGALLEPQVRR
jgi:hypothetical protein